jgi:hypothetical protein
MGKFIAAVGVAEPAEDAEETQAAAERAAREMLAATVADYTARTVGAFLEERGEYAPPSSALVAEFTTVLTGEVATGILRYSIQQDVWRGPEERIYVLYRMPLAVVHEEIARRVPYSLQIINPFGADAEKATADLQGFLDERLRERLKAAARERPATAEMPPEQRTPEWLEIGRHESYPAAEFLTAIGLGTDFASAEMSAQSELAARIDAEMAGLVRSLGDAGGEGHLADNLAWLSEGAIGFAEEDLEAAVAVEWWHDPVTDTHYALGALARPDAVEAYRRRAREGLRQAEGLHTSARNHARAGNYAASLKDYLDALLGAQRAVKWQLCAMVVSREAGDAPAVVSESIVAPIKQDLQAVLEQIRIEKVAGDRQWMPPGLPPRAPIAVLVTAGDPPAPAPGVPVRLRSGAGGEVVAQGPTDAAGTARWSLSQPPPQPPAEPVIVAELDLAALAPGADLWRLSVPRATFHYVLRSRANSYFAIDIQEEPGGGPGVTSPIADALKETLAAQGFQFLEEEALLQHVKAANLTAESSDAEVLDAYADVRSNMRPGRFLLVMVGQAVPQLVEKAQTESEELYIVYCPYSIRVIDGELPGESKTVLSVSGTGRAAFLGNELEATRRARAAAATEAEDQLARGLAQRLGPAPSRQ